MRMMISNIRKIRILCLLQVFWLVVFGLGQGAQSVEAATGAKQLPIAFAARIVGDSARGRLIVDFDQTVEHDVYLMNDPKRIVVELPETLFSLDGELNSLPKSLIRSLRYGSVGDGRSRMILSLVESAEIVGHRLKEIPAENRHRLFVDFTRSTDERFAALVRKPQDVEQTDQVSTNTRSRNKFTVVLDPGHGGVDGGASGANKTVEKRITLDFAQRLKKLLVESEFFDVILTRETDRFMGLVKRVEIAREAKADLFLSIHADSLAQKHIRGATVYTLSEEGSDDISRSLAKKQNRSDLIAGLELPQSKPRVFDILIDMTRRETELFSHQFASLLVKRMGNSIKLIRNPHRSADFYVLKAPEVPSILLELGYLSNLEDEKLMGSNEWQNKAVQHTFDAVKDFFDIRLTHK